jgi:hypothetical protein
MTNLTAKDLEVLSHILTGEEMACKKARVYANTLTDPALASQMERIASDHAARFTALYSILNGGKA